MPLTFGMPDGITDAMESALAAIQTAFGKVDGNGKWVDVVVDGAGLARYLRNDGAGNSWTVGTAVSHAGTTIAYTLVGDTMTFNFNIVNTALTVAAGIIAVYVRIPDGFAINMRRSFIGKAWMINAGAGAGGFVVNSYANYVGVFKDTAGAITDDSGGSFTVQGSIQLEVTRT